MASSTSTLAYDIIARDRASSTFSKIGRAAGALGIGLGAAGLVQFAKDSINVEAVFSQTMASLQVNSGVSERALGALSDMAVKFGQDTVFSANEAAQAMLELSKGGMSAAQIKGGALASTLNLAQTEGIALDESAKILSNTLHTFGLKAKDSGEAVDLLAAGAVASTASVEGLAAGLKYVGSTAASMNYPMNDVVTALAALNNAGLDASTAGTSLNRMLLGLTLGTDKAAKTAGDLGLKFTDAKGNMLPLVDVVKKLHDEFDGMATSQRNNDLKKLFGVEGMRAANILLGEGAKGWKKLSDQVNKEGVAQDMANARMSGTKGALERLSGSIETAQLKFGKALAPAVQVVADALADNLGPAMDGAIDLGGDVVRALEPLGEVLKVAGEGAADLARFFNGLPAPLKSIAIEAGLAALVLPRLSAGVAAAGAQFTLASAKVMQFRAELSYAETRTGAVAGAFGRLGNAARGAAGVGGMVALTAGAQQSNKALGGLMQVAGGAALGFSMGGPWGALIGGAGGGLIAALSDTSSAADKSADAFRKAAPAAADYASTLDQVTGATTRSTRAMVYDQLVKTDAIKQGAELGISQRMLIDYMLGNANAQEIVTRKLEKSSKAARTYVDANGNLVEAYNTHTKASRDLAKTLGIEQDALRSDIKETRNKSNAVVTLREIMKSLPKSVKTDIRQNAPAAGAEIKKLIEQYDLTPKQVQTLMKLLGVDKSIADIRRLIAAQQQYRDKTVTITTEYRSLHTDGSGPTRGRSDDNMPGGPAPRALGGAGTQGRFTAGTRGGRRGLTRSDLDGVEIRVTGVDPGMKAFLYTGGSSRYP